MKRHGSWIALDTFNRADGSLGTADSGQSWLATDLAQWGVVSNHGMRTAGTASIGAAVAIDSATANHTVEADITFGAGDTYAGLCFQSSLSDPSQNGWRFRCAASVCRFTYVLNGTNTDYESASITWSGGEKHRVKVVTRQSSGTLYIDAYIDNVLTLSRTETTYVNASYTGAGLYSRKTTSAPLSTFDSFKITQTP